MKDGRKFETKDIAVIGMLAAMCVVMTMIHIPYGNGAMVHLGSAAIFIAAIYFGGYRAGIAGAIGTAFFDLLMGFSVYTIWSFFIKGITGFIVGSIAHSNRSEGRSFAKNLFACLIGSLWTLVGYIVAWTVVIGDFRAALLNIPGSLMTSGVGIVVAMLFTTVARGVLERAGILKRSR